MVLLRHNHQPKARVFVSVPRRTGNSIRLVLQTSDFQLYRQTTFRYCRFHLKLNRGVRKANKLCKGF
jgi:hypothetical protein